MTIHESTSFCHPYDITRGRGRVPYAPATISRITGIYYPEGWVLPGGQRTFSMAVAMAAAEYIDKVSK